MSERILKLEKNHRAVKPKREDTLVKKDNVVFLDNPEEKMEEGQEILDMLLRRGAQRMLEIALEAEVTEYISRHSAQLDGEGHRQVVRNGKAQARRVQTGLGEIDIQAPRVHDKRAGKKFKSSILPPYLRRTKRIEGLVSWLYLKGISTGNMSQALAELMGSDTVGLSPNSVCRLTKDWSLEYQEWAERDLSEKRYVYLWADGIYFKVRLTKDRPCMLVLMGTLEDGTKELIAIADGERESKLSWLEVLRSLKRRGLRHSPSLAVGDGALGFWAALAEEFPDTKCQRCWVHKTANVLDKMPKKVQPSAKERIHEIYLAETKKDAEEAFDEFLHLYQAKYPKACSCLEKDRDQLMAFYDFPAEHWRHIRTTNPIESTFATIRHRTRQTKGCGNRTATLAMVFKLACEAQKTWRKINGYELILKVISGVKFEDGIESKAA